MYTYTAESLFLFHNVPFWVLAVRVNIKHHNTMPTTQPTDHHASTPFSHRLNSRKEATPTALPHPTMWRKVKVPCTNAESVMTPSKITTSGPWYGYDVTTRCVYCVMYCQPRNDHPTTLAGICTTYTQTMPCRPQACGRARYENCCVCPNSPCSHTFVPARKTTAAGTNDTMNIQGSSRSTPAQAMHTTNEHIDGRQSRQQPR